MMFAVIFVSIILIFSGYVVTLNNAHYLLAGYNTMSKKERENFDLKNYLKFFRKFMLNVALYTLVIYFLASLLFNPKTSAIIYAICISIPWPYFIIISNERFLKNKS